MDSGGREMFRQGARMPSGRDFGAAGEEDETRWTDHALESCQSVSISGKKFLKASIVRLRPESWVAF